MPEMDKASAIESMLSGMRGTKASDDSKEGGDAASMQMPRYKCHKQVWALKIGAIRQAPADQERSDPSGDWYLVPDDARYGPVIVGHDYIVKHRPMVGGYYVVYAPDGYKSYSPAEPFESGYTLI